MPEVSVADGTDWVRPGGQRVTRGFAPDGVRRIILDTDIASDVDDVGAIALLHGLANANDCEILATVVTSPCEFSCGALDALNIWHGRGALPIGYTDAGISGCGGSRNFTEPIFDTFPRNVGLSNTLPPSVDVYRETLAAAADGSVTICTIGFLTSLSDLLDSSGDSIDARNGVDLVAAKVGEVFIMGGGMAYDGRDSPEFNLRGDIAASVNVVAKCPVPITFNPWEIGDAVLTGKRDGRPSSHIVYVAYDEYGASASSGRRSWDAVTVLQAVRGNAGRYSTVAGTMSIDPGDGEDSFTEDAQGPHRYTFLDTAASNIEDEIEPLIWNDQVDP